MPREFDGKFAKDLYKLIKHVKIGDSIFSSSVLAGLAGQGYCVDPLVDQSATANSKSKTSHWLHKFGFVCVSKKNGTWERVNADYSEKDIEELVRYMSYGNGFDFEFAALLYNHLKGIPINHSINSSELASFIHANGYSHKFGSGLSHVMKRLGFECSGHGPSAYWYRTSFPELDDSITKEAKKTEAPTLQERLAAQIESGERKAPAGYSDWCAEQEKKEKGEMEQTTTVDPAIVNVAMEEPYEFETVEQTIKLVGKYGTYKVCSDGTTTVDLLVSGTLSNDELRTLERELNAVYCHTWRG